MESINEEIDTKNKKSNWGGKREGSGRPEGAESQATKDKKIVKEEMKQRIMRSKDALLNSQMNLAQGIQMLFKIETIEIKNKDGIVIKNERQKPELITSQDEIENYLAGDYDNKDNVYYFITTEKPDNKAIDSMFDRAFDKARQNVGVDGGEEGKPINIINYVNATGKIPTKKISDTDKPSV